MEKQVKCFVQANCFPFIYSSTEQQQQNSSTMSYPQKQSKPFLEREVNKKILPC